MRKGFLIYEEIRKYLIFICDFSTAPFSISLHMRTILFSFYQCTIARLSQLDIFSCQNRRALRLNTSIQEKLNWHENYLKDNQCITALHVVPREKIALFLCVFQELKRTISWQKMRKWGTSKICIVTDDNKRIDSNDKKCECVFFLVSLRIPPSLPGGQRCGYTRIRLRLWVAAYLPPLFSYEYVQYNVQYFFFSPYVSYFLCAGFFSIRDAPFPWNT